MSAREPLVLGIETSCDETGIGIVRGTTLLSNTIASSMDEHARYGGVVPEVAARAHLEALQPSIDRALAEAQVRLEDLDAVAVELFESRDHRRLVGDVEDQAARRVALGPEFAYRLVDGELLEQQLDLGPAQPGLRLQGGHAGGGRQWNRAASQLCRWRWQ